MDMRATEDVGAIPGGDRALQRAILEELVYEAVRQYAALWETVQYAQALLEQIDRAKRSCADDAEEQQRLVDDYTERAWNRLALEGQVGDA